MALYGKWSSKAYKALINGLRGCRNRQPFVLGGNSNDKKDISFYKRGYSAND